jgi:hypothetical protein
MESASDKVDLPTDDEIARNPFGVLHHRPVFHRFLDLPIELRYKVFEESILDEPGVVACRPWNEVTSPWYSLSYGSRFLPNICMTSRELMSEIVAFLTSSSTFDMGGTCEVKFICKRLSSISSVHDFRAIRRLRFTDANFTSYSHIYHWATKAEGACLERAQEANELCTDIVAQLDDLKELTLRFYAPSKSYGNPRLVHAMSIGPFLNGFNTRCLLQQKNLRKVILSAKSSFKTDDGLSPLQDDDAEKLRPVLDLGKQIKQGFEERGQGGVEVQVRLLYAGQCDVTTL